MADPWERQLLWNELHRPSQKGSSLVEQHGRIVQEFKSTLRQAETPNGEAPKLRGGVMPIMWTLDNTLPIIRAIDPIARRCNFLLALRGGVLLNGESQSDLDLCFLSEERPELCSPEMVLEEIARGMPKLIHGYNAVSGGDKYPCTLIFLRDGRHIDAHFWI